MIADEINGSVKRSTYKIRKSVGLLSTESVLRSKIGIMLWSRLSMNIPRIQDMIIDYVIEDRLIEIQTNSTITITFK